MRRQLIWALAAGRGELRHGLGAGDDVRLDHRHGGRRAGRTGPRRHRFGHVQPGHEDLRHRRAGTVLRALPDAGHLLGQGRADRVLSRGAEEHPGPPRPAPRSRRPRAEGRRNHGGRRGRRCRARGRHQLHHRRRHPQQRRDVSAPVGRNFTDDPVPGPGRERQLGRRRVQPVDRRRQRPREQLRRRRREHHRHRASAASAATTRCTDRSAPASPPTSSRRRRSRPPGFEAEYGQATGGVVNVVTKSGSNEFNGSASSATSGRRPLEGGWEQLSTPHGTVNTTGRNEYDFGISVGGPLVKDKAFFFGTYQPPVPAPQLHRRRRGHERHGRHDRSRSPRSASVDRERRSLAYAGKVTWQVSSQPSVRHLGLR